ncbi:MAG TPA: glycine--tRNA ligase subunit beta [Candidatus Omnitrophica bacterium]|nr:glycine--tRNA ligase subunit beta [Candidatus Omnitrophota bacterium]
MKKQLLPLNLLVEIGAEELPLSALDLIYADFKSAFSKLLERERISFSAIEVEATPRRIAFFVEGLATRQKDSEEIFWGPVKDKSFEAGTGNSTPAFAGFLKSQGAQAEQIVWEEKAPGAGFRAKFTKQLIGQPTQAILPSLIQEVFQTMQFKRGLRWDATGYKFPRPIRWIVALLGNSVLKFKIADVTSGKTSLGHRFLSPKTFSILKADWQAYHKLLEKQQIILSIEKREAFIREGLSNAYSQKNLDEELVHECAQLVEKPFLLEGGFSTEYLELPAEVLATCMKKHQRVFAVYQGGKLQNKFVAVMNGKREGLKKISADFEKVLDSRLKDARFFFKEDTQKHLEGYREKLRQLAYLGSLGSMLDKSDRLVLAAQFFAGAVKKSQLSDDLKRVCSLAKCDLLTHLVFEMPELQGIVGGEYARHFGEKKEVSAAIATQYLPKNLSESHPAVKKQMSELAALFGVLDRLDLLIGAFGTGIEPTGSQDPFALRRAGGLLVKLIRAFDVRFSLTSMTAQICTLYGNKLTKKEGLDRFYKFLQERIAFELGIKAGSSEHEILQAVFKTRFDDIADVFTRYEQVVMISCQDQAQFAQSIKVVQRISNILKGAREAVSGWQQDKLVEEKEIDLAAVFSSSKLLIEQKIAGGDFRGANRLYAEALCGPVMAFFDKVMVNAEDLEVRKNRLGLLTEIRDLYTRNIADLSLLSRVE